MHRVGQIKIWYNSNYVAGFLFLDKSGNEMKQIGSQNMKSYGSETITLEEGETIAGVRYCKHKFNPRFLSNLQFVVTKLEKE